MMEGRGGEGRGGQEEAWRLAPVHILALPM